MIDAGQRREVAIAALVGAERDVDVCGPGPDPGWGGGVDGVQSGILVSLTKKINIL
jgi:hypothetical protein